MERYRYDCKEISRANRDARKKAMLLKAKKRKNPLSLPDHTENVSDNSFAIPFATISSSDFFPVGLPEHKCEYCGAILWFAERLKSCGRKRPKFSLCCRQGRVKLPLLKPTPTFLENLFNPNNGQVTRQFRQQIRRYNAMFAFTSLGAKIDMDVNNGTTPYRFRISGQIQHRIGSLLPREGQDPTYAQLYVYDTENELENRAIALSTSGDCNVTDRYIINGLMNLFDEINVIAKVFRTARDRFECDNITPLSVKLLAKRGEHNLQYNEPVSSEIATLIVGDFGESGMFRDVIVAHKFDGLKRVSNLHPLYMAMQYPILFPYGEDDFLLDIPHANFDKMENSKDKNTTMREYYAYRLQYRAGEGQTLLRGGRLFQQYVVDAFSAVEDARLSYCREHQEDFRSEKYKGIQDSFMQGINKGASVGKRIILPSTFTGSQGYMMQNYYDAIAISKCYENPDLFITFTCNVQWPEIINALSVFPGQSPEDRPDIVTRIFKMKVDELMSDIRKESFFGRPNASMYTIEFQKRGLPHVHILVWLQMNEKTPTAEDIDRIISAELPNKDLHPMEFELVTKFMVHGPCGNANAKSPCMENGRCKKHFPKKFATETKIDGNGTVTYRRRNDGRNLTKNNITLDNTFVVPYNICLLKKYHAHINVKWCNKSKTVKYLFKYVNKDPDRCRAALLSEQNNEAQATSTKNDDIDEI